MNQRIRLLAEQARFGRGPEKIHISENGVVIFYIDELEKFAELIIKECVQVSEDDISDGDACCTNTADRIARQIKKHFGVES